jgi:ankyrin repeat protein
MVTRRTLKKKFKKPTNEDMFLDYVATGRRDLVEEYLDKGGSAKVRNCKGETALHIAAANNKNDILEILLPYFTEDEMDIRDMYGLPAYITAVKYGNEVGAKLITTYHKMIKTKPYRFKNYSFASDSAKPLTNNAKFKNILNKLSPSDKNPIIYPNENEGIINILSYLPKKSKSNSKSPFIAVYNNKNTRKLIISNKKKASKKHTYHISRTNLKHN